MRLYMKTSETAEQMNDWQATQHFNICVHEVGVRFNQLYRNKDAVVHVGHINWFDQVF